MQVAYLHYVFLERVVMAYLDSINCWPQNKGPTELSQQSSSNDTAKTASLSKAPQPDAKSLSADRNRRHGLQLDTASLHMPIVPPDNKVSHFRQLNRWANKGNC